MISGSAELTSTDPTSGEPCFSFEAAGPEAVEVAVSTARSAVATWSRTAASERARCLREFADWIDGAHELLVGQIVKEVGKPVGEAREEVTRAAAIVRYYATACLDPTGVTVPGIDDDSFTFTTRAPLGHVGLITPWNFPIAIPLWKIAPALAYGNTVVSKPAPQASGIATCLTDALTQILPEGAFTSVLGGPDTGRALAHSPLAGLSFTGSTATGLELAHAAIETGARYQGELGGKNASVVLADAAVDESAATIASAAMGFAGQKCTATSRVIVERPIAKAFRDALVDRIEALRLGAPGESSTDVGPLISSEAADRVESIVQRAIAAGAEVLSGGRRRADLGPSFYEPTLLDGVAADSEIGQTEIFGPVLALFVAEDADEALAVANGTEYGLAAAVFTKDLQRALEFVHLLDAGIVRVNAPTPGVQFNAPFDPAKASSIGSAELGKDALTFFTRQRTVTIRQRPAPPLRDPRP